MRSVGSTRNGYRQLAGALASIGLLVGAWVALSPIAVDAPHADGRCGPPLVRLAAQEKVDDPNAQRIIDRCEETAAGRLVLAGAAVAAGVVAWVLARGVGRRQVMLARERHRMERARVADAEHQQRLRDAAAAAAEAAAAQQDETART